MNTGLNNNGSTNFLNFSTALNHLRWGDKIARRKWADGVTVEAIYSGGRTSLRLNGIYSQRDTLQGHDIMAEDWYVL